MDLIPDFLEKAIRSILGGDEKPSTGPRKEATAQQASSREPLREKLSLFVERPTEPKPKRQPSSRGVTRRQMQEFNQPEDKSWMKFGTPENEIPPRGEGSTPVPSARILGLEKPEKMPAVPYRRFTKGPPTLAEWMSEQVPDISMEEWGRMTAAQKKKRTAAVTKAYDRYVETFVKT